MGERTARVSSRYFSHQEQSESGTKEEENAFSLTTLYRKFWIKYNIVLTIFELGLSHMITC